MAELRKVEQALRRARRADVAGAAESAAQELSARAAHEGLLDVAYTTLDSPVGPVLVAATQRGLVRISFGEVYDPEAVLAELSTEISPRVIEAPSYFDAVRRELEEYFHGQRTRFNLPLDWRLTGGFTRRVLRRTARIPYGKVSTYREVAAGAGSPRGARAAGNALNANPIPIVVPCHRVLHSGGGLGGYGGGAGPQGVPAAAGGRAALTGRLPRGVMGRGQPELCPVACDRCTPGDEVRRR